MTESSTKNYTALNFEEFFDLADPLDATGRSKDSRAFEEPGIADYRTVTQIEFMNECVINGTQECCIVHFYSAFDPLSSTLDEMLEQLSTWNSCRFLRINAKFAPLFTSKLKIGISYSTVVALCYGEVLGKMSCFSSPEECVVLKGWVAKMQMMAGELSKARVVSSNRSNSKIQPCYRTVTETDILNDCLNEGNHEFYIVHFFVEDSSASKALDEQMEQLAVTGFCKFLRTNVKLAPFLTSKLNISTEEPSVVALKDGTIFDDVGIIFKGMWEIERVGI